MIFPDDWGFWSAEKKAAYVIADALGPSFRNTAREIAERLSDFDLLKPVIETEDW